MAVLLTTPILWALGGIPAPGGTRALPPSPAPRLLLVVAPGLGWDDLGSPPGSALGPLRDGAVVALVTVGAGQAADPWSRSLSLGAGEGRLYPRERGPLPPAAAPETRLEDGVEARALWRSLTGRPVPDRAGLLLFAPPAAEPTPLLGDRLRAAGLSVVLIGGGVGPSEAPAAAALLAGSDGLVLGAALPEPLRQDGAWPGLQRTDWARLSALAAGAADASLLVLQWGDLQRLEAWEGLVPRDRYRDLRQAALAGAVEWLGQVSTGGFEERRVLLLSLAPARSHPPRAPAPLILFDGRGPGLALSGSTRRPGILDPGDVAPTVLELLGERKPWQGTGRPATVIPSPDPFGALDRFYRAALGVSALRRPVLHTYIVVFASMVLGATLLFALAPDARTSHPLRRVLDVGILVAAAAPLAMLAPSLFTDDGRLHLVLVIGFCGLVSWSLWTRVSTPWRYPVLAGLTFAALTADTVSGANLQLHAFLGNDPLGGARYYGVGNEYMGILLGSGLVAAGAIWERHRRAPGLWLGVAVLAILVVVLAHPRLGANVGGAVAALFGSAYLCLRLRQRPPRWLELLLVGVATVAVLGAIGVAEALTVSPESRSHLGQIVARTLQEGWGPLLETAARKLATNLKLIEYTVWSRVLIATLVAFVILLYRPVGLFRQLMERRPFLGRGLEAALVAALTALVVNDSGVLAAATAMVPTMSTLLTALRETRTAG